MPNNHTLDNYRRVSEFLRVARESALMSPAIYNGEQAQAISTALEIPQSTLWRLLNNRDAAKAWGIVRMEKFRTHTFDPDAPNQMANAVLESEIVNPDLKMADVTPLTVGQQVVEFSLSEIRKTLERMAERNTEKQNAKLLNYMQFGIRKGTHEYIVNFQKIPKRGEENAED